MTKFIGKDRALALDKLESGHGKIYHRYLIGFVPGEVNWRHLRSVISMWVASRDVYYSIFIDQNKQIVVIYLPEAFDRLPLDLLHVLRAITAEPELLGGLNFDIRS